MAERKKAVSSEKKPVNLPGSVKLDAMPPSAEARKLTITGANTIELDDVLVGEVWICSGTRIGTVAVNVTQAKNVTKPRGADPGTVQIKRERTLKVKPGLPK